MINKKEMVVIAILFIIGIGFSYFLRYSNVENETKICFEDKCFRMEIADDNAERLVGLMNRTSLGDNKGMLFVFEHPGVYPFWMKNTLIPLDIVWLNSEKEIVYIYENALPCIQDPCPVINPGVNALYVLEFNSGTAAEIGLNTGDKVDFAYMR